MILSYTLILPISQLQTQQLMTLRIRSDIEYLIQTHNILVLILYSKLMRNVAALAVFFIRFNDDLDSGLLFGPLCIFICLCFHVFVLILYCHVSIFHYIKILKWQYNINAPICTAYSYAFFQ